MREDPNNDWNTNDDYSDADVKTCNLTLNSNHDGDTSTNESGRLSNVEDKRARKCSFPGARKNSRIRE